jgi:COMPASS component SPP1
MCRLPGCRRPAALENTPPSKYCTPQHGVEYMTKHVIPFSTFTRSHIAALATPAPNAAEFKKLGDRIPTPPPPAIHAYPEETRRLAEIAEERVALVAHQKRILQRGKYALLAQERKVRITEELKNDPDMGKVTNICGFDTRMALDDAEWDEWCNEDEGREVFETGVIPGRDGVCLKKTCRTHKGWQQLFTEEQNKMERERLERVVALKKEERKIRERQKRRAVKDESEGWVKLPETPSASSF